MGCSFTDTKDKQKHHDNKNALIIYSFANNLKDDTTYSSLLENNQNILTIKNKFNTIIGINIGASNTFYSKLSYENGKYSFNNLLMNSKREIPSLICYGKTILIGENSKNFIKANLNNSYNNLSRIIGYDKSKEYKNEYKYMFDGEENIKNIKEIGSECIIADFLYSINQYFILISDKKYDLTCISVPDFYTSNQKQILEIICKSIDMKNIFIYNESSAITMFYGYINYNKMFEENTDQKKNNEKYVLFIDIGHSKSSFILSKFKYNEFKVEKVFCEQNLGGRNIELMLYDYCIEKSNIDKKKINNKMKYLLLKEIQEQKKRFVNKDVTIQIKVEDFIDNNDLNIHINEKEFKKIISKFIEKIESKCEVIKEYIKNKNIEINTIECAGNLIKLPVLQNIFLEKKISTKNDINEYGISQTIQTNECTSVGAMLLAKFNSRNFILNKLENFFEEKKNENINNNNYLNINKLKEKVTKHIQIKIKKEVLYKEFTEKKNIYMSYMKSLKKINKMNNENFAKLQDYQRKLLNYTYNNENDIQKINILGKDIKQCAINIINDLIKKIEKIDIKNKLNDINNKLNNINQEKDEFNEDDGTLFKQLEELYSNGIDNILKDDD